ncbi:DUF397 domain-containing protein [Nocardiopsis prasina]|uniref:DUF397 domain-containing protein n=1 Tax=Nocardiopsis prasina TaxID=2015 RepID=UPI000475CB5A|nr:DUF397 domain-containing protein [Nocardiopsis prasina]
MHLQIDELRFRKSSYSTPQGQNCVEVARYRESSHSATASDCMEVAGLRPGVAVRDSKFPGHGHLLFPGPEWVALLHTK